MSLCIPALLAALVAGGCGRSDLLPGEAAVGEGSAVKGAAALGTQCPYGSIQDPRPRSLRLWECAAGPGNPEFLTPPKALVLSADCGKNVMTVRSPDRSVDFMVEIRPNRTFSAIGEGGTAVLADDGTGKGPCTAYMQVDLRGHVDCKDRDRASINVNTYWWPANGTRPPSPAGHRSRYCKMPKSCYFHAETTLHQCS